jgi:hypothetical protein
MSWDDVGSIHHENLVTKCWMKDCTLLTKPNSIRNATAQSLEEDEDHSIIHESSCPERNRLFDNEFEFLLSYIAMESHRLQHDGVWICIPNIPSPYVSNSSYWKHQTQGHQYNSLPLGMIQTTCIQLIHHYTLEQRKK